MLNGVRDWCNRNRIFFETIGFLTLTIMGIVVSLASFQLMMIQTDIMTQQTALMESENLPILNFEINNIANSLNSQNANETIIITNSGSPIRKFELENFLFFDFIRYESTFNSTHYNWNKEIYTVYSHYILPLDNLYYKKVYFSNNQTGLLMILTGNFYDINTNAFCIDNLQINGTDKIYMKNTERYFRIKYQDNIGKERIECYFLSEYLGSYRIPCQNYEKTVSQYAEYSCNPFSDTYLVSNQLFDNTQTVLNPFLQDYKQII